MRETALIAVAIAVSFWFFDLLAHERSAFFGEHFSVFFAHAWRSAMAALVRFVDAKDARCRDQSFRPRIKAVENAASV
jgi:hypothetical protein